MAFAAAAEAEECVPQDRSDAITDLSISDSSDEGDEVRAWESVSLNFAGSLPTGGCAGDTITITVPSELRTFAGTYPVLAADGTQMGTMVVSDGVATITFNDYLETHENVTFEGFLSMQLRSTLDPGTDYDLDFTVGSETWPIAITTEECPDCQDPITDPTKYADFNAGEPDTVTFGISTAQTHSDSEAITITDTVGSGQELDCDSIVVLVGSTRNVWGDVEYTDSVQPASIACDTSTVTVTLTSSAAGQYYRLIGTAIVTAEQDSYTDTGSVTQDGVSSPVQAEASGQSGEVSGDGDNQTTAMPTPTPSETTPTPAEATQTPTPSETTPSESPSTTSSTTTSSTTTTTTSTSSLPQTGTDASAQGAAVGLLLVVLGGGALIAARRRH
ncbi:Ig-like domain-containing protein [Micropruina sp.]|uniref:Ig-like domain-containing protein n=1 Tax=Micropruina sp. TaxID=2737536 RepID=UPI0039E2AED0